VSSGTLNLAQPTIIACSRCCNSEYTRHTEGLLKSKKKK